MRGCDTIPDIKALPVSIRHGSGLRSHPLHLPGCARLPKHSKGLTTSKTNSHPDWHLIHHPNDSTIVQCCSIGYLQNALQLFVQVILKWMIIMTKTNRSSRCLGHYHPTTSKSLSCSFIVLVSKYGNFLPTSMQEQFVLQQFKNAVCILKKAPYQSIWVWASNTGLAIVVMILIGSVCENNRYDSYELDIQS